MSFIHATCSAHPVLLYLITLLSLGRTGYLSQYSVWLQVGRPGDLGSIPGRGESIFPLASLSRPALGPTQPPVQWEPGVFSPGLKAAEA
jgi:hypothetical protein